MGGLREVDAQNLQWVVGVEKVIVDVLVVDPCLVVDVNVNGSLREDAIGGSIIVRDAVGTLGGSIAAGGRETPQRDGITKGCFDNERFRIIPRRGIQEGKGRLGTNVEGDGVSFVEEVGIHVKSQIRPCFRFRLCFRFYFCRYGRGWCFECCFVEVGIAATRTLVIMICCILPNNFLNVARFNIIRCANNLGNSLIHSRCNHIAHFVRCNFNLEPIFLMLKLMIIIINMMMLSQSHSFLLRLILFFD
mmetsp:Transcript_30389/g.64093  ORF Transcript_30389/g.64093 Transcript_30389/m.64093 type:complete len:247 (+) Transcript_30389:706-1446(+)